MCGRVTLRIITRPRNRWRRAWRLARLLSTPGNLERYGGMSVNELFYFRVYNPRMLDIASHRLDVRDFEPVGSAHAAGRLP